MEKFFALIKSTKDVRDRITKEKKEEKAKGVWNLTFQLEDFANDEEVARINILHPPAGPSEKEKREEAAEKELTEAATIAENENKEKARDNLDLTLSL
ncbi:NPR1/NH1-interacting protein [Sesbania bispinosa]|nr:NPR1/NH1-interacting protein [Sesbania bispinosa]